MSLMFAQLYFAVPLAIAYYPQFGKIKLRSDENIKVYPSLLKAKKILNWKPTIQFKRGLFKTIKSYE